MRAMKRLWILALVAGCSAAPAGGSSPGDETGFEKFIVTQLAFDVALLKPGDYVLYRLVTTGETRTDSYHWGAVAQDATGVWVENKVPAQPNPVPMIIKSKFDRAGTLLERWVGEAGSTAPAKVFPSTKKTPEPSSRRDSGQAQARSQETPDSVVVGGKTYACTKVTTELVYPGGRKSTLVQWFSKEVPFAPTTQLGGLVKRQLGRTTMELLLGATGRARAELEVPPR
jgi:hypothetical protein